MANSSKKAQSEIMGFVLIVVLVIVIGVIFLGIGLRKDRGVSLVDAEISNFLTASQDYTTACFLDAEPNFETLGSLTRECYAKSSCKDGKTACEVLNQTYYEMSKRFAPAGTIKYFKLSAYFQGICNDTDTRQPDFLSVSYGNSSQCAYKRGGQISKSTDTGCIFTELQTCREE